MEDIYVETPTAKKQLSNLVFCFDPFFRKWSKLPSMAMPRADFVCTVIDSRVFVAGGGSASVEAFDLEKNTWDVLPEMSAPLNDCLVVAYKGRVQVLGYSGNGSQYHHFVLDVNEWKVEPQKQEMLDLDDIAMTEMDGPLYGIFNEVCYTQQ